MNQRFSLVEDHRDMENTGLWLRGFNYGVIRERLESVERIRKARAQGFIAGAAVAFAAIVVAAICIVCGVIA